MFFASSDKFASLDTEDDTRVLILRMHDVPELDATAVKNLFALLKMCEKNDIKLLLSHVDESPCSVMKRAGFVSALGEESFLPNIDEALNKAKEIVEK